MSQPIPLNNNHRRIISTTLTRLDEMICDFERWAKDGGAHSVLFTEHNALNESQRAALLVEITAIRETLSTINHVLHLDHQPQEISHSIWAPALSFRENLVSLLGNSLKSYGEPSPELSAFFEPRLNQLIDRLDRIARIARGQPVGQESHPHGQQNVR